MICYQKQSTSHGDHPSWRKRLNHCNPACLPNQARQIFWASMPKRYACLRKLKTISTRKLMTNSNQCWNLSTSFYWATLMPKLCLNLVTLELEKWMRTVKEFLNSAQITRFVLLIPSLRQSPYTMFPPGDYPQSGHYMASARHDRHKKNAHSIMDHSNYELVFISKAHN